MAVTVSPDGRLVADAPTIERLKALCAQDEAMLKSREAGERVRSPRSTGRSPARGFLSADRMIEGASLSAEKDPSDANADIEATLVDLMAKCHAGATEAFRLATEAAQPG